MVRCKDETLYTGVTTDLERRVKEHNGEIKRKGAKCTQARRPVELVYSEGFQNRSVAQKREAAIKKLSKEEKEGLVEN